MASSLFAFYSSSFGAHIYSLILHISLFKLQTCCHTFCLWTLPLSHLVNVQAATLSLRQLLLRALLPPLSCTRIYLLETILAFHLFYSTFSTSSHIWQLTSHPEYVHNYTPHFLCRFSLIIQEKMRQPQSVVRQAILILPARIRAAQTFALNRNGAHQVWWHPQWCQCCQR